MLSTLTAQNVLDDRLTTVISPALTWYVTGCGISSTSSSCFYKRCGAQSALRRPRETEPKILASVDLGVENANGELLRCDDFVDKNLEVVFRTVLDVGADRKVLADRGCRARTGRGSYCLRLAIVPFEQAASVDLAKHFRHLISSTEEVRTKEGLALVLKSWRAYSDPLTPVTARKFATVWPAARESYAGSTSVDYNGSARENRSIF